MQEKELSLSSLASGKTMDKDTVRIINERLAIIKHCENISDEAKQHIIRDIARNIKATRNRILFTKITGKSPQNFFQEATKENCGEISLSSCLQLFNEKLEKALANGIIDRRELVQIQHFKIAIAEMIADLIALHESETRATDLQDRVDNHQNQIEIHQQIDEIIDRNSNNSEHRILHDIAIHLRNILGTKDIESISISYANENNDYGNTTKMTRVTSNPVINHQEIVEELDSEAVFPARLFSATGSTSIYEPSTKTHFIGFRLGKKCFGIIEIKFKKNNSRLSTKQETLCKNAITSLDTFLNSILKEKRERKIRRKIERILDRAGTDIRFEKNEEKGFRTGIIRALTFLCEKTAAKLITLNLDIMGDGKSFTLNLYVGPEGEMAPEKFFSTSQNLESRSHKITIPPGNVIDDNVKTVDNGTITFYGEDFDQEDLNALEMTAEKLISAVRNWRNDLNNTINYGLPPRVALLRKQGLLKPMSVENLTMTYTDLHGFTAISERVNEITAKYGLRENYMMRLIAAYDQLGKEIAEQSGGCFDKLVGDCLIIHAGPPYTTDGRDGLGIKEQNATIHAINGLKIALRLRHHLSAIQKVYEQLLSEMAKEIEDNSPNGPRSIAMISNQPSRKELLDNFCETYNIPRYLRVTQGITSGKATVGLVRNKDKADGTYSSSYTVIGDEMNIAARLQAQANPDEILISSHTKILIEQAIKKNIPIPFNCENDTQDWESFKQELLGNEYKTHDLIPIFEETMLSLKNKQGFEFAYRLTFEKVPRMLPNMREQISEPELRAQPGYYKIINNNDKGDITEATLENMVTGGKRFTASIRIPRSEIRYVTKKDYDARVAEDRDMILKVKEGKITRLIYAPVDDLINEQLAKLESKSRIYEPSQIPHGIYTIKNKYKPACSSFNQKNLHITPDPAKAATNDKTNDYPLKQDTTILEIEMNGKIILVQVNDNELLDINKIKERPKAQTLFKIYLYSYLQQATQQKQMLHQLEPALPHLDEILFIHSSGEYIGSTHNLD